MNRLRLIALLIAAAALTSCSLLYHAWDHAYRTRGGYYDPPAVPHKQP